MFFRIFRPFFLIHTIHINLELSTMYKIHKNRHFSSNVKNLKKYGGKSYPHKKTGKM